MSLILEALKKAERQHRMGEVPGIGVAHHDDIHKRSRLLGILLLGLVAIGMLSLGLYLGDEEPVPQVDLPAEPTIELPLPVSMQPTVQVESLEPVEREPEPVEQQAKVIQLRVPKPEPAPEQAILDEKTPLAKNALRPPDNPGSASAASQAKRLNQLPAGFIDHLPKMNIDIHSYDKQRARSYVLINMEKYREGDYLAEGPLLSEILADGVVLEHMGERFILPIGNY